MHNCVYDFTMNDRSLADQLAETRATASAKRAPDEQAVRAEAVQSIRRALTADPPVGVGDRVPPIKLSDQLGRTVDMASLLLDGPVVLAFYRGGWCPYCNLTLRALQSALDDLKGAGATLVAITPELPDHSLSTSEKNELSFPVLSDPNNEVGREFRIVFPIAEDVVALQLERDRDVAAHNGAAVAEVPLPATYVIGRDGVIRYAFVDADHTRRAEPATVVDVVNTLVEASR